MSVEGNPAEKADKVPYLQAKRYSTDCSVANHDGQLRTLLAADDMVDTVMQKLADRGELANTLVIFTTDNGYSWGERGVTSKGLPYTEHVQAPFLVRWDGVFPAGGTDDRLVGGEDFLPTYLQAAQYSPPEVHYPLDGRSFLPGQPGRQVKLLEFGPLGRPRRRLVVSRAAPLQHLCRHQRRPRLPLTRSEAADVSSFASVIRVFVIEDTPEMRLLLEQMLTLDDFDVVGSAANGASALPEMNQADPDVVVLDYNMPGLDGLLTARLIKEERPDQAIILYTAYLDAELEEKAARAGIALCVEKADGILTLERDIRRLALPET